jgi:hypothetical protein
MDNPGTQPEITVPVKMPLVDGEVLNEPFTGLRGMTGYLLITLEAVK